MIAVRQLELGDLPEAAALFARVWPLRRGVPELEVERFLSSTLFDHPAFDPELPSLVATEGDEIVGMIGAMTRRMVFDGEPIRMVCSAHLCADPRVRGRGIGARLLKTLLGGPQDLTITNSATDEVRRMWEAFGGATVQLGAFTFVRAFRPWSLVLDLLAGGGRPAAASLAPRVAAGGLDRVTRAVVGSRLTVVRPPTSVEALHPDTVAEHIDAFARDTRLYPGYDTEYTTWLLDELRHMDALGPLLQAGVSRGGLLCECVRAQDGRVVGWYICHLRPRGVCRVAQLVATPRATQSVLDQLLHRAERQGAAAVYGRVEPHLVTSIAGSPTIVAPSGGLLLVHSARPELTTSVLAGDALLTRMEGEWW